MKTRLFSFLWIVSANIDPHKHFAHLPCQQGKTRIFWFKTRLELRTSPNLSNDVQSSQWPSVHLLCWGQYQRQLLKPSRTSGLCFISVRATQRDNCKLSLVSNRLIKSNMLHPLHWCPGELLRHPAGKNIHIWIIQTQTQELISETVWRHWITLSYVF